MACSKKVQRLLLDCLHLWLLDRLHLRLPIVCATGAIVETQLLPLLKADLRKIHLGCRCLVLLLLQKKLLLLLLLLQSES